MARCFVPWLARLTDCVSVALLLSIVVFHAGCKRSTSVVGPRNEKTAATAKGDDQEVVFKSQTGEEVHFAGGDNPVASPAEFPADVAIYPKATVTRWSKGNGGISARLKTADSVQDVEAFYKKRLRKDGWKLDETVKVPHFLKATKQGRALSVDISTQSGGTTIDLTVANSAEKP
jgi:hypothetical protein